MSTTAGRIDQPAFKGVVGTLFGLSILTATIRTIYRIKTHGRLLFDDFLLVFACVTLTTATGLLYVLIPTVYLYEEVIFNPKINVLRIFGSEAELLAQIIRYRRLGYAFVTLTWTTIFSVKICFLLFFLQLIDRLKKLMFIWKIVFAITIVVCCFCAFGNYIACPRFGKNDALRCNLGTLITINLEISFAQIALDIVTDLLIIMIPVILLWNVKIKSSQKILLGIFLCLSVCMIISAIVRVSGLRLSDTSIDMQWELFFQHVEASVSVITVSITAFRSLLGLKALKSREKKERAWYSHRRMALFKKERKTSEFASNEDQLPSIPSATLTGIRTFIQGNKNSKNGEADIMSSRDGAMEAEHYIQVTQKISSESEAVRLRQSALSKSLEGPRARKAVVANTRELNSRVYAYD